MTLTQIEQAVSEAFRQAEADGREVAEIRMGPDELALYFPVRVLLPGVKRFIRQRPVHVMGRGGVMAITKKL